MSPVHSSPGILLLLYRIFFKPLTLERQISDLAPNHRGPLSYTFAAQDVRPLAVRLLFHLLITPWLLYGGAIATSTALGITAKDRLAQLAAAGAFIVIANISLGATLAGACAVGLSVIGGLVGGLTFFIPGGLPGAGLFGLALGLGVGLGVGLVGEKKEEDVRTVMAVSLFFASALLIGWWFASVLAEFMRASIAATFAMVVTLAVGGLVLVLIQDMRQRPLNTVLSVVLVVVIFLTLGMGLVWELGAMRFREAPWKLLGRVGLGFAVGFILGYLRLFFYLVESVWSFFLSILIDFVRDPRVLLRYSPLKFDELIWFPLVGLDRLLIAAAENGEDREAWKGELLSVSQSFRQGWAARSAFIERTASDLERTRDISDIARSEVRLAWLPPELPPDLQSLLPPLKEITQRVHAGMASDTLANRVEHYQKAKVQLESVRRALILGKSRGVARRFGPALATWTDILEKELVALRAEAVQVEPIPNVYVAGAPLANNSRVFKGRNDLFKMLERELVSAAEQQPTLMLLGPRRTGKSSVLKQLPERLGPDYIPAEIDLQEGSTAENAAGLLLFIARRVCDNALNYRSLRLPQLAGESFTQDVYMSFFEWVKDVEEKLNSKLILLNLDEFERLEEMKSAGRLDNRMFDLLRSLIQHHPHWIVLLSGSHALEDLESFWNDYLINVRVLKIGVLEEKEARELVVSPVPEFPLRYEDAALARILAVTGRQPYLIQATCRDLVHDMNERKRHIATVADVEHGLNACLTSAGLYFQELWDGRDSDSAQRKVMMTIARDTRASIPAARFQVNPESEKAALRLIRREIIELTEGGYRFTVELVRRWVRERVSSMR